MSLVTPTESNGTDTVTAASPYPKEIAKQLAADFAETAIERAKVAPPNASGTCFGKAAF
jgi:hypothetical protein